MPAPRWRCDKRCGVRRPGWTVCGLPAALYSDHGADFTSSHISAIVTTAPSDRLLVGMELHIRVPGHPEPCTWPFS